MKRPRKQKQKDNMHVFRATNMNINVIAAPKPPQPNKGLCLYTNATDDEDLVRNSTYRFNSTIETLINDSETSRFATLNRKNGVTKAPRRQNAWIIYRRDKSINPEFIGLPSKFISQQTSKMWDNEPKETIELFKALARIAEKRHIERYGADYRYNPKDRRRQMINEDESLTPALSSSKFEEQKNFPTPPISPITFSSSSSSDSTMNPNPEQHQPFLQFSTNIYYSYYMN